MSPVSSLRRTLFLTVFLVAAVPLFACAWLWYADLQRTGAEHSPQRVLLGLAAALLVLLPLALAASRWLALRIRRAAATFADLTTGAAADAGELDPARLPLAEFEPLLAVSGALSQRTRIKRELRHSEQRFNRALEAAGVHLWDIDLQTRQVIAGASLFHYLGLGDARPLSIEEMLAYTHPDDIPPLLGALDSPPALLELRLRDGEGYRWFSCRGGVVETGPGGRSLRLLGTATDITTRKAIEAELIAARVAAEDASHAKSQFLSSVSHELLTPLNGVLGYTQIMLRDPAISAEQQRHLAAIESCGGHLLTLINDVLDLSRIESGSLELNETSCDLGGLLQAVAEIGREHADAKLLDFTLDIAPSLPAEVVLDEVKLKQILVNLLSNAVKFTHRGGVTLRVWNSTDNELHLQVRDTGIGIEPERQRELFEPFRQGQDGGGAGVGLAISQRLCELMRGQLEVQSAPDQGSVFTLSLPCRTALPQPIQWHDTPAGDDRTARPPRQLVAALAPERLAAMRAAIALGDLEAMRGELQQLQQGPEPLATLGCQLHQLLDNFDIEALRELLESAAGRAGARL